MSDDTAIGGSVSLRCDGGEDPDRYNSDSERERVHVDFLGWLKEERPDGTAIIETSDGGLQVRAGDWHRCVGTEEEDE